MAWNIEGTYFETCSCDVVCPCTWSSLTRPATHDFCKFVLAFHIDSGNVEGTDVGGRNLAVIAETPKMMTDGNWKVGVFVDDGASTAQTEALTKVISGQLGGPMAMLAPLIGEFLGVENAPIELTEKNGTHQITVGSTIEIETQDLKIPDFLEATSVSPVMHPANTKLTISPPTRAQVDGLGISFGGEGLSGFSAPVSWSG